MQEIVQCSRSRNTPVNPDLKKVHRRKTPRTRQPEDMSLKEWQTALRREFGREQNFKIKNIGKKRIFSEFEVTNPETKRTYCVEIRGNNPGENYCSCPDFAVNTLGTCKHIEFTLAELMKKRGARNAFARGFLPVHSEVYLRYGAKRDVLFRAGTGCQESTLRLAMKFFDSKNVLRSGMFLIFDSFLKKARSKGHEVRCREDALNFVAQLRDQAHLRRIVDDLFPENMRDRKMKNLLKVPMYPFQQEGAIFAARSGHCLMADDMGLGKTIQAIAAVEILKKAMGVSRVLVVAPTSLKYQWKNEIEKFSRNSAQIVEGMQSKRLQSYKSESFFKITNYDVIGRDFAAIQNWAPDVVILDEAQRIKNWKTKTAKSVKQLKSDFAIVLTGTPLENRLEELHSIVEFIDPFRLGPLFGFLAKHQHLDECGKVIGYRNLSEISKTLSSILIRRKKDAVLRELPERMEKYFFVPVTEQQMNHHEENRTVVARIVSKWRRLGFLPDRDQRLLMIALQNMRMSCNSTYLLDRQTDHSVKPDELITFLEEVLEQPDTKVVIFSQWTRTHELLIRRLEKRNLSHVYFHGGVPIKKRNELITRFKKDSNCRIFLSTDAGGLGLNLQNANVVINMDQPWNPATLEQRIGRVHRLGQNKSVRVIHFVSQGTIEHSMLDLLSFKKSLFDGVLDDGRNEVFLGETRLKLFMKSVESVSNAIPGPMLQQKNSHLESISETPESGSDVQKDEHTKDPDIQGLSELITAGKNLLERFSDILYPVTGREDSRKSMQKKDRLPQQKLPFLKIDTQTNRPCISFPLPPRETIRKAAQLLESFLSQ